LGGAGHVGLVGRNPLFFPEQLDFFLEGSSISQYDNLSRFAGLNTRFRWIITPGTDLYLVYNQNWQDYLERMETLETQAILKMTYTNRF
jgi:hypothetical protein